MSWFSKVGLFLATLFLSLNASAERVVFHGEGRTASLETQATTRGEAVAPVEIHLSIPGMDVTRGNDGFNEITIDGLAPLEQTGNPSLYTTGTIISVPDGYRPELTVVSQEERVLENFSVKPSQRKFRCGVKSVSPFTFNSALYLSDVVYPAKAVELEEVGKLQGLTLARVGLNPLRMDMGKRALHVTTDMVVRVDFRAAGERKNVVLPATFYQIARNFTANGRALGGSVSKAAGREGMLIVVADTYKTTIAPLVSWKRSKGLDVTVVTTSDAGGTKDKIKSYIQTFYDAAAVKPSYLLMIGNATQTPTFMESTASGSAAGDWKYSLLTGGDNIPDVVYGRLTANNEVEVDTQINRWIAYEKKPTKGTWFPNGTTIASSEGSGPSDKEYAIQIQDALKKYTYKAVDGFYQGDSTATFDNISKAVDSGRSWITYFGHGSGTSWGSTNTTFNVSSVASLDNEEKLPIVVDVACQNGSWVRLSKCFGKAWVTAESHSKATGAVAFLGGSVNVSWHEPAVMAVGIAKSHFEKPITNLGGSVLAGQLFLIAKMGSGSNVIDNLRWYNLLGDPSLVVRTDVPKEITVKAALGLAASDVSVQSEVVDTAGKPVSGLNVAVATPDGSVVGVGETDKDGKSTITLTGVGKLEPSSTLTVTGYNVETYQEKLN